MHYEIWRRRVAASGRRGCVAADLLVIVPGIFAQSVKLGDLQIR